MPISIQHMPPWKVRVILAVVALLIYMTGLFTGLDIATTSLGADSVTQDLRFARSVLCALLVLSIGSYYIDRKDRRLLVAAFALCVLGDCFLIFGGDQSSFIKGVAAFTAAHLVLSRRHADGWRAVLGDRPVAIKYLLMGVASAALSLAIYLKYVSAIAAANPDWPAAVYLAAGYLAVLSLSLWMGWTTLLTGAIPRYNSVMIAVGITAFYVCDVSLGLAALVGEGLQNYDLARLTPDLTYSPALGLLALSGFDWVGYEPQLPGGASVQGG